MPPPLSQRLRRFPFDYVLRVAAAAVVLLYFGGDDHCVKKKKKRRKIHNKTKNINATRIRAATMCTYYILDNTAIIIGKKGEAKRIPSAFIVHTYARTSRSRPLTPRLFDGRRIFFHVYFLVGITTLHRFIFTLRGGGGRLRDETWIPRCVFFFSSHPPITSRAVAAAAATGEGSADWFRSGSMSDRFTLVIQIKQSSSHGVYCWNFQRDLHVRTHFGLRVIFFLFFPV